MMFLWLLVLIFHSVCCLNLPDITDRSFMDLCLREHNKARSEVQPPATDMRFMSKVDHKVSLQSATGASGRFDRPNPANMGEVTSLISKNCNSQSWDAGLAVIAQSWARHCIFEHNPEPSEHPGFSSLGENLWVGTSPSYFSVTFAVQRWVNETVDYSYYSNSCTERKMCGHYTQVVWARSYKVGCAVHLCQSGIKGTSFQSQPGANFVCNYGPAGNVIGQRPYQTNGEHCSKCDPEDSCVDRLCRNKGRDPEKGYSWGPAKSEPSASDFASVLIIRPVALLGSVITAIAVKYFYPDIFCYE